MIRAAYTGGFWLVLLMPTQFKSKYDHVDLSRLALYNLYTDSISGATSRKKSVELAHKRNFLWLKGATWVTVWLLGSSVNGNM